MTAMQWRKANGSTGEYDGPLVPLGHGIPRKMGSHGLRRALYDLASGYTNGFPLWDVLTFSARSLFPQPMGELVATVEVDDDEGMYVGTVYIPCPACGDLMPATVSAEIADEAGDGAEARLVCTPDMTDIHAHVWGHGGVGSVGGDQGDD